ncbi:MAG: hypothetical protein WC475_01850 [Candidatus Paceibacterota bacterium]
MEESVKNHPGAKHNHYPDDRRKDDALAFFEFLRVAAVYHHHYAAENYKGDGQGKGDVLGQKIDDVLA